MALCRFITNTMAGVPTLSGTAGELVTYLDAVLVNGCNSGSCTLSQAAGVATLSRTGHGFVNKQVIEISGATPSAYNGLHRVTYVDANTVTFPIDSGTASPATGTISCKTASLGWTIAYTGTHKRVYEMGSGSLGFVLRVDDTGTPQAYGALIRMGESATDVDTLVDPFPTAAQINNTSQYWAWNKSNGNNSTVRATFIQGDEKSFVFGSATAGTGYSANYCGEFTKLDPADAYNCACFATHCSGTVPSNPNRSFPNVVSSYNLTTPASGAIADGAYMYIARAGDQVTKSDIGILLSTYMLSTLQNSGYTWIKRPYGATNGFASVSMFADSANLRGVPRGVFDPGQSLSSLTQYDGADFGLTPGTTYVSFSGSNSSGTSAFLVQMDGEMP